MPKHRLSSKHPDEIPAELQPLFSRLSELARAGQRFQMQDASGIDAGEADTGDPDAGDPDTSSGGDTSTQPKTYAEYERQLAQFLDDVLVFGRQQNLNTVQLRWLLFVVTFTPVPATRAAELWRWATSISAAHLNDAVVVNMLGTIGGRILEQNSQTDVVSQDEVAALFRRSLDLDPDRANNFDRAARFFMLIGDESEAERCFARAFRLDRGHYDAAWSLADIYGRTDRARDALEVLDMCLRDGADLPRFSWQAAVTAFGLQSYEATLTYLKQFEPTAFDFPWLYYYRSAALLALGRNEEAIVPADKIVELAPDMVLIATILKTTALANSDRQRQLAKVSRRYSITPGRKPIT